MSQKIKIVAFATLLVFGASIGFLNHALQNNLSLNPLHHLAQVAGSDVTQYDSGRYGDGRYGGGEIETNSGPVAESQTPPEPSGQPERIKFRTIQNKGEDFSGREHVLRISKENSNLVAFRSRRESEVLQDTNYRFPVGLYEFEAEVDAGETETVTIELDRIYDTSDWTYRKYIDGGYIDITNDVTFTTQNGITTIIYDVEDNGPLDSDSRLGFITDPAGPAIEESSGGQEEETTSNGQEEEETTSDGSEATEEGETSESESMTNEGSTAQSRSGSRTKERSEPSNSVSNTSERADLQTVNFNNNISFVQPQFNIREDVRNLEQFLNVYEREQLVADGVYDSGDVEAVKRFQRKYSREILDVWDLTEATGYVGITTRLKMNFLIKGETASCPAFTEYNGGLRGVKLSEEIGRTQEILSELDMYAGPINNRWDSATNQALITFQETFREVMLDPWNITEGTGYKYKTTNKFLNYFVGCDTGAVYLEGVGTYEGI